MSPPRASTSRYPATAFSNADSCHPSTLPASHLAGIFYMAVSEAGARLLQKCRFFRCAGATQYVVTVGEAAKALDDHLMVIQHAINEIADSIRQASAEVSALSDGISRIGCVVNSFGIN